DAKSTGSSASHVSLSNSEAVIVAVPAIAPEIVLETTIVAPPSPNYVPASLDYFPISDPESDLKDSPSEDPLEDDSSSDDACETAGPVAVHATPAPLQIVHAPPASPAGLLSLSDLDKRSFSV
ncbi:hypothetical protein Tco_0486254, partial [Tanacetum coccineum]